MPLITDTPETVRLHPAAITRRPTILLVDDDTGVRRFLHGLLRRTTNAHIVDVPDTIEAMRALQSLPAPPDLLVTDVDLGAGPNGFRLANVVSQQSRSTRIVLMSGNPIHRAGIDPLWRFLAKPFTIEGFVSLVQESLVKLRA